MADNNPHIFLKNIAISYDFRPKQGFGSENIPVRNRDLHSNKLLQEFTIAENAIQQTRRERGQNDLPVKSGSYWEFSGRAGYSLVTKSLEDLSKNIRLLNIKTEGDTPDNTTIKAVAYVPEDEEKMFRKKITDYKFKNTKAGNPKNANLVNSIESISLASISSLWTDDPVLIPNENQEWCEVWLYIGKSVEEINSEIQQCCELIDVQLSGQVLVFPERMVRLIRANRAQLMELVEQCDFIAEMRLLRETARFWLTENNADQVAWVQDLLRRASYSFSNDIGVCILDTGINNAHLLLAPVLDDNDKHSVEPGWGLNDHDGHGTLMAGISAYGDLQILLESQEAVEINHKLSSVKILPPTGQNDKELYGVITSQGISRSELAAPNRKQVYCMAVTSQEKIYRGRPTSWSSAIDQLAFGEIESEKRLIIISAGNVRDDVEYQNYPNSNVSISVEDPAQAWNALTIGAITDKIIITDPAYNNGHSPIANIGELSPYSSTSTTWEHRKWPLKPDIVLEGGNILKAPDNSIVGCIDDFAILSTSRRPLNNQFDAFSGTSAATAYTSWMCAKILSAYPNSWPETLRGLIIHSAEWTAAIINQFSIDLTKKQHIANLMRICGYGVPNIVKAIQNTQSSFTLIAEEEIKPFSVNEAGRVIAKDMHFFKLPWPKEMLLGLAETKVKFRITLSYFIEPAPGEIGWKDRYRYQSYGFRFDVNNPTETEEEFLKRINLALRDEDEVVETGSGSDRWKIGPILRNLGLCTRMSGRQQQQKFRPVISLRYIQ
ncbi:MAG: S8 family peptidase [Sphingobacteriales bacterium]|nr:S8 family peptidase [Sphingobacteriales bacterium]